MPHADQFKYLGSVVVASGERECELSRRLQLAGTSFQQLRARVFVPRSVGQPTKLAVYNAVVQPTLLYGAAATWGLTRRQSQRVSAFHNTCLRRILNAQHRHPAMLSNQELYTTTKQRPLLAVLTQQRLGYVGHAVRMGDASVAKQLLFSTGPRPPPLPAPPPPPPSPPSPAAATGQAAGHSGVGPPGVGMGDLRVGVGAGMGAGVGAGSAGHVQAGRGYTRFVARQVMGGPRTTWKLAASRDLELVHADGGNRRDWMAHALIRGAWRITCQTAASRV